MESKTKNRKTRQQIARMIERAFEGITLAEDEDAIIELMEGWFNVVYRVRLADGREVILKIAPPQGAEVLTYEQNIMATEVASMRQAAGNPAIPVPEIYLYDTAHDLCDSDYFLMEKLSGENYGHVKESLPPEVQAQIDRQIGVIVREINGSTGPYYGYDGAGELRGDTWEEAFLKIMESVLADGSRKQAEYGFTPGEIREVILKHTAALEAVGQPQMVHWDAWDLNFFVQDGNITGILDFERVLWGDPLMEAQFRVLAWGGVTESLRGYGKTEFSDDEIVRCHLYDLHLGLVMKTECYYRNYDTDEISNMGLQVIASAMQWLREN